MDFTATSLASVDEDARRRFESAWRGGRPPALEAFLPAEHHPRYRATLEELVLIDLELWWKFHGQTLVEAPGAPCLVEKYLESFPCLKEPATLLRLVRQEFRARKRYGDPPSLDDYLRRFPDLA